jgi:glycosyltransferase involved in cell wall biosynthesis
MQNVDGPSGGATASADVTVITPVRDEGAVIDATAQAITAQRFDGSVEFLFIDGRSEDDTRERLEDLARRDPRVQVLDNPSGDLASALAIGLTHATGEFVAKMDAHTYFPDGYLQLGVDRLRLGDTDWVSGPPIPHGIDAGSRRVALALGTWMGVGGSAKWARTFADRGVTEVELDTGVFSGVWRRSMLLSLGGWDPAWPVNEDSELASRYLERGGRILCLEGMGARYIPRSSLRSLARQYGRYGFFRAKTARRHPRSLRRSHLMPPALVLTALAAAVLPGRLRLVPLAALAAYGAGVAAASVQAGRSSDPPGAVLLPAVFAVMHAAWGTGFIAGCLRFGIPARAFAQLARQTPPSAGA